MWGERVRMDSTQCLVRMEGSWGKETPLTAAKNCDSLSRTGAPNLWTSPGSFHPESDTLIVGKPVKIFLTLPSLMFSHQWRRNDHSQPSQSCVFVNFYMFRMTTYARLWCSLCMQFLTHSSQASYESMVEGENWWA